MFKVMRCVILMATLMIPGAAQQEVSWYEEVINCVVLIMKVVPEDGVIKAIPVATGFFVYGYSTEGMVLVTNRHVLEREKTLLIRFRSKETDTLCSSVLNLYDAGNNRLWIGHPDTTIDIGVVKMPKEITRYLGRVGTMIGYPYSFFLNQDSLCEADDVVFFGFPLGITDPVLHRPVTRRGVIALIGQEEDPLLIDGFAFFGSSGSPVCLRPNLYNKIAGKTGLVGIISGFKPFTESASSQTGMLNITISTNTGLTIVYPAFRIKEVVDLICDSNK